MSSTSCLKHAHFTCTGKAGAFVFFLAFSLGVLLPGFGLSTGDNSASARLHADALKTEKSGNVRAAIELEKQAASLAPNNVVYVGELARLLWAAGYVDRAIQECQKALKLAPSNAKCRFNLAVMLQTVGDPKMAILEYEKVLKDNPGNIQARHGYLQSLALAGRSQESVDQLGLLIKDGKRFPLSMIDVADTAIKIDQPHRAKEILREPASAGNARALSLLYLAAAQDGDDNLALSIQKKVLDSAPRDARIYLIAAKLAESANTVWVQEQILNQSMKCVRNDGDLYAQLAGLYTRQFAKAKASGDEKNGQVWLNLADRALAFAEEIHVKAWRYRFAHAGVYALQGKHKEAADLIDELAGQEPKNELIAYCRGRLHAASNNPAAAAKRGLKSLLGERGAGSDSFAHADDSISLACSRAYFEKLGCGCHTAVLELKWKRSGGVLFAKVISEHPAVALIVHQLGDLEGYKGRIISAAATINERIVRVETEPVRGLGALSLNVAAPEAQAEPPLMARLQAPELEKL